MITRPPLYQSKFASKMRHDIRWIRKILDERTRQTKSKCQQAIRPEAFRLILESDRPGPQLASIRSVRLGRQPFLASVVNAWARYPDFVAS